MAAGGGCRKGNYNVLSTARLVCPLLEPLHAPACAPSRCGGFVPAVHAAAPIAHARDMRDAVRIARARARPGDTVLLSPACASFDMYANYRARGDDFAAAVDALDKVDAVDLQNPRPPGQALKVCG